MSHVAALEVWLLKLVTALAQGVTEPGSARPASGRQ
jgi:hypothetical protein